MEDAQQGTDRENVSTRSVKVVINQVADVEEDVLEEEVQEETVDKCAGLLDGAASASGEDEGGGEGESGEDFDKRLVSGGKSVSQTTEVVLDETGS